MDLLLKRFAHSKEYGTFSLAQVGVFNFFMVEQDWENNEPFISCIPNGEYHLSPFKSEKFGECLIIENELLGVSKYNKQGMKRYGCLIHAANRAAQLEGCLAPGANIGMLNNEIAVLSSKNTLNTILSYKPTKLIITSDFPTFKENDYGLV